MSNVLKFSIITVVYNGEQYLEETILSIITQSYDNIEYIIIDGGSTDGTLDIIKKYKHNIAYCSSEEDNGIYDAMNKGVLQATGDYIAFINADDWYEKSALQHIANAINLSNADLITANINIINQDSKKSVVRKSKFTEYGKNIHHQTCFIKLSIHKHFLYDTQYKLAGDKDLIVRLLKSNVTTYFVDKVVANFREGGTSSDRLRYYKELFHSNRKNVSLLFAIKRFYLNIVAPILFRVFRMKR